MEPSNKLIEKTSDEFSLIAKKALETNTKVALLICPNKSSIYKEYLPKNMPISNKRYSSYYTDKLSKISNLTVFDPTDLLIKSKLSEGVLYWRSDSHWNQKGAYISFNGLIKKLDLIPLEVDFSLSNKHKKGDLLSLSRLNNYDTYYDDDWDFKILSKSLISKNVLANKSNDSFGWKGDVYNKKALNNLSVWVIGDSFTSMVKPYINSSFRHVKYLGHWAEELNLITEKLSKVNKKPDLILILKVERSF